MYISIILFVRLICYIFCRTHLQSKLKSATFMKTIEVLKRMPGARPVDRSLSLVIILPEIPVLKIRIHIAALRFVKA